MRSNSNCNNNFLLFLLKHCCLLVCYVLKWPEIEIVNATFDLRSKIFWDNFIRY